MNGVHDARKVVRHRQRTGVQRHSHAVRELLGPQKGDERVAVLAVDAVEDQLCRGSGAARALRAVSEPHVDAVQLTKSGWFTTSLNIAEVDPSRPSARGLRVGSSHNSLAMMCSTSVGRSNAARVCASTRRGDVGGVATVRTTLLFLPIIIYVWLDERQ